MNDQPICDPDVGSTATNSEKEEQVIAVPIDSVPARDYPQPRALSVQDEFEWNDDLDPIDNYRRLGTSLAQAEDIYRLPGYASGLLLAPNYAQIKPQRIVTAAHLAPVILDRVRVCILKEGKIKGGMIANGHLSVMLRTEVFLQQFRPLDDVSVVPQYLANFELTKEGYNDGGLGSRFLYIGGKADIKQSAERVHAFLSVMDFKSPGDRTNAVGAALTVMLRNHWPGGKPLIAVTATKSHAGKDTIIAFACGRTPNLSISFEPTDWALQKNFIAAVTANADIGVVNIENARLGRSGRSISSAFLERLLTDARPLLYSTGTGSLQRRDNHLVVALSTNFGAISEDLMNRALPIHLAPVGNVQDRQSIIGNPKFEYLPKYREEIEAEMRGMIEKWKAAGRPLDTNVRHPFTPWAQTIGGILAVNGFTDFLANYHERKTVDDELRQALGHLAAAAPDQWLRPADWARLCKNRGLVKKVVSEGDRDTDLGLERGIGVVLSDHDQETFEVETEMEHLTLKLEKGRRRFDGQPPQVRYRFKVLSRVSLAEDPEPVDPECSSGAALGDDQSAAA